MKRKNWKVLSWLLALCLFCSILTGCGGEQQELDNQEESSSAEESSSGWGEGPVDPVITPEPTADPDEGKYVIDVTTIDRKVLELRYASISQDYLWMTDPLMAGFRAEFTQIGDAFAMPIEVTEAMFREGTLLEQSDIPFSQLNPKLTFEPNMEQLKEALKVRQKELAAMSRSERFEAYEASIAERFLRSPQYQAAFASMAKLSPTLLKNNTPLLESYFSRLAEYNTPKLTDFSEEVQKRLTEEKYEEMIAEILHPLTEEEMDAVTDGGEIFPQIEDRETLNLVLDELAVMPYGLECWREYNPEHPGDLRFVRMTDEGRWFGIYFYEMWRGMPTYGKAVMTTTHNWVSPELKLWNRTLTVQEADYQENVPDSNGKVRHQRWGYWRWFPWKDSLDSNQVFAGIDMDDGRLMLGEPTRQPIVREDPDTTPTPTPGPTATPGPGRTTPTTYGVTLNCVDTQNQLLWTESLGNHAANTVLTVSVVPIPNYHYVSGLPENGKYAVKAGTNIITLVYDKNSDPPGPTPGPGSTPEPSPNPTPDPTNPPSDPTPTPAPPDGQGGKDPMTGTSPNGDAPIGGGNTAAGDPNKDLNYNEELQREQENLQNNPQSEANRQEQQQQQQAAQGKSDEEEKAAQAAAEKEAENKGQPAGTTGHDNNPAAGAGGTTSGNTGSSTSGETTGTINASGTIGTEESKDSNGNTTAISGTVDSGPGSEPSGSNEPNGGESGGGSGNVSGKLDPPPPEDD